MALSEVGERISERFNADEEIRAYADALADMLCAYMEQLWRPPAAGAEHERTHQRDVRE